MQADIGIIGGSGFYSFLDDAEQVSVETPFGAPSAPLMIGQVGERMVAFIPRHGAHHEFEPHRLNYRANLWALRTVGVRQVLAPSAVGSLRPELDPGTFVIPDQVIDRTYGRAHSVYEGTGKVFHLPFADPYCPQLRQAFLASSSAQTPLVDGGTLVVINGPRFSSKAESKMNALVGGWVVGMTGMPEAVIAKELAMCYATVSMVTDHDAGVDGHEPVTNDQVIAVFESNLERMKSLLRTVIANVPAAEPDATATCECRRILDGFQLPFALP